MALLAGSFFLSWVLTAVVRVIAVRVGFVSKPVEDRFSRRVVPLGGGIAIFITLAAMLITGAVTVRIFGGSASLAEVAEKAGVEPADFLAKSHQLIIIILCAFVLFAMGLVDDKKHLGPGIKLLVQFVAALVVAGFAQTRVEFFIENRLITSILSAVWIVIIINAFNFLDNMDGLAAGIAAIACSILFVAAAMSGQVFVGGLAILVVGTLLGFLVFNFPPAGIYMGDAGSLVVGFFVALLTLRTTYYHEALSGRWYPVLLPIIVMAVPLYDSISVTLLRISQEKSPFVGDTQHFSHRLQKRGLTNTQTVLTLYLATLATGLGAIFLYQVNSGGAVLILAQTFMVLAIVAILESTGNNDQNHQN